jgi:hypothetical protein
MRGGSIGTFLLFSTALLSTAIWAPEGDPPGPKQLAKEYIYPEAKVSEEAEDPGAYRAKFATPDEPRKVAAWLDRKFGRKTGQGTEGSSISPERRVTIVENDRQPKEEGKLGERRPASVVVLQRATKGLTVTAVVSRAKDEKLTHVVLLIVENK